MIPKIIHYFWFGRNPLPSPAKKCIASWKKFLPDHEIKEWNEDNFDVDIIPFTQEAYSIGKYAFVSDYARLRVLYHYGGIYFDTDVEVVKDMTSVLLQGPFMAIEKHKERSELSVALGLGFSAEKNDPVLREIMQFYENNSFEDIFTKHITIVTVATDVLIKYGFNRRNELQKVGNFTIYPYDYFCPVEYPFGKLELTPDTVSIHHFAESWLSPGDRIKIRLFILLDTTKYGKTVKRILKSVKSFFGKMRLQK